MFWLRFFYDFFLLILNCINFGIKTQVLCQFKKNRETREANGDFQFKYYGFPRNHEPKNGFYKFIVFRKSNNLLPWVSVQPLGSLVEFIRGLWSMNWRWDTYDVEGTSESLWDSISSCLCNYDLGIVLLKWSRFM